MVNGLISVQQVLFFASLRETSPCALNAAAAIDDVSRKGAKAQRRKVSSGLIQAQLFRTVRRSLRSTIV
jgi:hypothetical protein